MNVKNEQSVLWAFTVTQLRGDVVRDTSTSASGRPELQHLRHDRLKTRYSSISVFEHRRNHRLQECHCKL